MVMLCDDWGMVYEVYGINLTHKKILNYQLGMKQMTLMTHVTLW